MGLQFLQRTVLLVQKIKFSWEKKTFTYQFMNKTKDILFSAKTKSRYPSHPVPIDAGSDVHMSSENHDYYLQGNDSLDTFALFEKTTNGEVISSTRFYNTEPRSMDTEIYSQNHYIYMMNKKPTLTFRGSYQLDFHNRITITSEKNVILLTKVNDPESGNSYFKECIYFRKFNSNVLMIDLFREYSEIVIFSIGLSIILTKV